MVRDLFVDAGGDETQTMNGGCGRRNKKLQMVCMVNWQLPAFRVQDKAIK